MITLDSLKELAGVFSFTGCEGALSEKIKNELSARGLFTEIDPLGNLFVSKSRGEVKRAFIVPLDTPGFLTVVHKENETRLLPAGVQKADEAVGESVVFRNGGVFTVQTSKKESPSFQDLFIQAPCLPVGTPCRIKPRIEERNSLFIGRFSSAYILMRLMMNLSPSMRDGDAVLFAAESRHARAAFAYNAAKRYAFQSAVMLGAAENKGESVLLAVKDGGHFSDPVLIEEITSAAKREKIPLERCLIGKNKTKAENVACLGIPVCSLFLPCVNRDQKKESVPYRSVENLEKLLQAIL